MTLHQRGNQGVVQRIVLRQGDDIAITVISVEEQLRGRLDIVRRHHGSPRQVQAYEAFQLTVQYCQRLRTLAFDSSAYDRFVELRRQLPRLGSQDLRIAAIALTAGATLVTRNSRDFSQVPGLTLEDWSSL